MKAHELVQSSWDWECQEQRSPALKKQPSLSESLSVSRSCVLFGLDRQQRVEDNSSNAAAEFPLVDNFDLFT